MEKQNYDFFLFVQLVNDGDFMPNLAGADSTDQFVQLEALYNEYLASDFNSWKKSAKAYHEGVYWDIFLRDCMMGFLTRMLCMRG